MIIQRHHIVGSKIVGIWELPMGIAEYSDHFLSLDNGITVKFSWGKLEPVDPLPSPLSPAEPLVALGAPGMDGDCAASSCLGLEIIDVVYSRCKGVVTDETERRRTYFLLKDGRYLTSGLGFNYTELELDSFKRWCRENKFASMFCNHWDDSPFNPFGPRAIKTMWNGSTVIGSKVIPKE